MLDRAAAERTEAVQNAARVTTVPASVEAARDVGPVIAEVWPGEVETFKTRIAEVSRAWGSAARILVARDELRAPIGAALVVPTNLSFSLLELTWVSVRPNRRHEGIGRAIVSTAIEAAQSEGRGLILATDVPAFYERSGCGQAVRFTENRWLFVIPTSATFG